MPTVEGFLGVAAMATLAVSSFLILDWWSKRREAQEGEPAKEIDLEISPGVCVHLRAQDGKLVLSADGPLSVSPEARNRIIVTPRPSETPA